MRTYTKSLTVFALLALLAIPCLAAEPPLTLTATLAQSDYPIQEFIEINLTLTASKNISHPVIVSTESIGTVCVEKLTKGGTPVKPSDWGVVFFYFPPQPKEIALQPGQSVSIPFSEPLRGWNYPDMPSGMELKITRADPFPKEKFPPYSSRSYFLTAPGEYEIQFCYQYKGSSDKNGAVGYGKKVKANIVTFRLHDSPKWPKPEPFKMPDPPKCSDAPKCSDKSKSK